MSLFPFDPLGTLPSNRIQNESHTLSVINGASHSYIVPENAPFYDTSLTVIDQSTGQALIEGDDYFYAYPFMEATENTGLPISGGIGFVDVNRNGTYIINYQTLGGDYVDDQTRAIDNGLSALDTLVNRDWDSIVSVPATFPPTPHTHRADHMVGLAEILAKFNALEAAIRSEKPHISVADIVDLNEGFIIPLKQSMAEIAAAIELLGTTKTIYHAEASTGNIIITLGAATEGEWITLPVEITPTFDGTYMVQMSGNPRVTGMGAGVYPMVEFRFLVDGSPIGQSTLNGSVVGLARTHTVSLQMRIVNGSATAVVVADTDVSCNLTLLRVGD